MLAIRIQNLEGETFCDIEPKQEKGQALLIFSL